MTDLFPWRLQTRIPRVIRVEVKIVPLPSAARPAAVMTQASCDVPAHWPLRLSIHESAVILVDRLVIVPGLISLMVHIMHQPNASVDILCPNDNGHLHL